jgi:hypothetical protein
MIGMGFLWVAALGAGAADACMICGPGMNCAWSPAGGRWCLSGSAVCMMGGACAAYSMPQLPPEELGVVQVTIVEDASTAGGAPARVVRGAGRVLVGRAAAMVARGGRGFAADDAVVFSARGYTEGGTAVFRSPGGDGFTLAREPDGRGAHLRVCALAGSLPGRVLADERVGEEDALIVRVPFEGRTRLLVLESATLPRTEAQRRDDDAGRALREWGASRPEPSRPPFELKVLDR